MTRAPHPKPGETANEYIARVDREKTDDIEVFRNLQSHFAMSHGDAKTFRLSSVQWWKRFVENEITARQARGASRYAAMTWARKNNRMANGEEVFSDKELEALIEAAGPWAK